MNQSEYYIGMRCTGCDEPIIHTGFVQDWVHSELNDRAVVMLDSFRGEKFVCGKCGREHQMSDDTEDMCWIEGGNDE